MSKEVRMSDDLFRTVVARRAAGRRRLGGVPVSIAIHTVVIAAVFIISMLSVGPLPMLRERLAVVLDAMAVVPSSPLPPSDARLAQAAALAPMTATFVPLYAPTGIGQENVLREPTAVVGPPSSDIAVIPGGDLPSSIVEGTPLPPPAAPKAAGPVRPGGDIQQPRKTRHVTPVYPPLALAARVEGVVTLDAVIAIDGSVQEVRVLASASPLLNDAASEAVRQWRFTPTTLNGIAVPVILTVRVEFKLR
jgi:protein TonB